MSGISYPIALISLGPTPNYLINLFHIFVVVNNEVELLIMAKMLIPLIYLSYQS